jgi:hypothetical protein
LTVQAFAPSRLFSPQPLRRLNRQAAALGCAALLVLGAALPGAASAQKHGSRASHASANANANLTAEARNEMAACNSPTKTKEERASCLDEVRRAQAADRLGKLQNFGDFKANALKRCDIFKDSADLAACRARLQPGNAEGSVAEGGILREVEIQVPSDTPPAPMPTPDTQTMPTEPAAPGMH